MFLFCVFFFFPPYFYIMDYYIWYFCSFASPLDDTHTLGFLSSIQYTSDLILILGFSQLLTAWQAIFSHYYYYYYSFLFFLWLVVVFLFMCLRGRIVVGNIQTIASFVGFSLMVVDWNSCCSCLMFVVWEMDERRSGREGDYRWAAESELSGELLL